MKQTTVRAALVLTLIASALLVLASATAAAGPPQLPRNEQLAATVGDPIPPAIALREAPELERVTIRGMAVMVGTQDPVPDASVWFIAESGRIYRPATPVLRWLTREDGTFEVVADPSENSLKASRGLPPGRYEVMVHKAAAEGEGPEEDLWPVHRYLFTITAERARQGPIDVGVIEMDRAGDLDLGKREVVHPDGADSEDGAAGGADSDTTEAPPGAEDDESAKDSDAEREASTPSGADENTVPPEETDSASALGKDRLPRLVITTAGGTIVRAGATSTISQSTILVDASGHFSEQPVDAPCEPSITFGPFAVEGGGRLRATVQSAKHVPNRWSLGNSNTWVDVFYAPWRLAKRESTKLLSVGDVNTDPDTPYLATGEADWPAPGQFTVVIGPPRGSGPLAGSCLEQTWSAKVEIISLSRETPADAGLTLDDGDVLRTGSGEAVILLPDGSSLHMLPDSELTVSKTGAGAWRIEVTRGRIGSWSAPGGAHGIEVVVAGKTIRPTGTRFSLQWDGQAGWLAVAEGTVGVSDAAGAQLTLAAGQQLDLASGAIGAYDPASDPTGQVGDVPLDRLLVDDSPHPYGEYPLDLADGQLTGGWVLEDPGQDASLQSPQPGTLQLTVPDGNDMWDSTATAPRLLHKVTGDFDLQAEMRQACQCTDLAISEFLVYSPGSYLGYLAEQMARDGRAAHYRLMGGWWRMQGYNKLGALNTDLKDCPDAPDGPVQLRLTRRGDVWKIYWSLDGQTWDLASREEIQAPDTLWVGWLFKRVAADGLVDQPALNTLRDVRLVSAAHGSMSIPGWDFVRWAGRGNVKDGVMTLALDGSRLGEVRAERGEPLTGDFDAIARFETKGWKHQPGQMRGLTLQAASGDDKNMAYSGMYQRDDLAQHYRTDLELDGSWGHWQAEATSDVAGWIRVARRAGKFEAYYWGDCEWKRLDQFTDAAPYAGPLYLGFSIGNNWEPTANAALRVRFRLEQYPDSESPDGAAWQPQPCSIVSPVPLPKKLKLPDGMQAQMFAAPFGLGNLFFAPDGTAYVFSAIQGDEHLGNSIYRHARKMLLALVADGRARRFAAGDVLAGVNWKSGTVLPDGDVLMTVDAYREGGNAYGGLYQLAPDGSFRQWQLTQDHGGLSDIIPAPDGGWYFADFESDNVWYLAAEGVPETPLITQGEVPPGMTALAYDQKGRVLYALNQGGDWPFGGAPGVYQISPGGEAIMLASKGEGESNFGGIAFSQGGSLPKGLYVSDPDGGRIFLVKKGGQLSRVISGLPRPGAMRFDPASGGLLVVCDGKYLVRIGKQ